VNAIDCTDQCAGCASNGRPSIRKPARRSRRSMRRACGRPSVRIGPESRVTIPPNLERRTITYYDASAGRLRRPIERPYLLRDLHGLRG